MSKIYIIDGNSLLFRSFYATYHPDRPIMTNKDGVPTNAIYLYQQMMSKIKSELSYDDKMVVCFDTGRKSFRTQELESYKMNRKPIEPSLKEQFPLAREMLDDMGILYIEQDGYEGDDLAGSLVYYANKNGDDITLFTSDKDFLQLLISDRVQVKFLRKGLKEIQVFTKNNIHEQLGYHANQVVDYKGLVGDSSDNIPGIKGVGEKTAIKLLNNYQHLEDIFEGIKDDKSKVSQNILQNKDTALFCRKIATIVTDIDVSEYYKKAQVKNGDNAKLLEFYRKYDLNNAYKELLKTQNREITLFDSQDDASDANSNNQVVTLNSFKELKYIPKSILACNSSSNFHEGIIEGFYFSNGEVTDFIASKDLIHDEDFKNYLISNSLKSTYDLKGLIVCLDRLKLPRIKNVDFDLLIATYILKQDVKQDKVSCLLHYGKDVSSLDESKQFSVLSQMLIKLKDKVITQLKENGEYELYSQVELPLTEVLADMEIEGFPLNKESLAKIDEEFQFKLKSISNQIISLIGYEINLNSPKQLAKLIYDDLKLKKKGRNNSTSIDVLIKLYDRHPIIPLLIEYRKYQKLVSSYTSSLARYIQKDGKIHAIFNQALTNTGRLSMSEPNLQNISIRDQEAKEIRKAFYYDDSSISFLSLDYSQIELRVLASLASLEGMIDTFNNNIDIHTSTASKIYHCSIDEVSSSMRRKAKAVNFGIVYGISPWGLAEQLKVSNQEAKEIIDEFYNSYPGLKEFEEKVISYAKENGYVKTILGRRRYIKEIYDDNKFNADFGKRAAVNSVIQGSAADLIKIAMIQIQDFLKDYQTKMVLQIHDELIFKVPKSEVDIIQDKLAYIMEHAMELKCKLLVEGSFGQTWYDCK